MEMGTIRVLDLFSGMGGFSYGFAHNGFDVTGADQSRHAEIVYRKLVSPNFINADLRREQITGQYDIVIGGPPCKPWSPINVSRRTTVHRDYDLVKRFADHIKTIRPEMFILENVPALRNELAFSEQMRSLSALGYSVETTFIKYSDYGAATSRRRLFAVGLLNSSATEFIDGLKKHTRPGMTLRRAIEKFAENDRGTPSDHVWPELKTISRYAEKYRTGKYGWRILDWDSPAPSFGNVMKTYILHPDSDPLDPDARVVSVLEVSRIMGFNHGFKFPDGLGVGERYQMLVDSVSPVFSDILARYTADHFRK